MRYLTALCAMLLSAAPAAAHEYPFGDLVIVHPYASPTAPDVNVTGGYMEIYNGGDHADRLLAVRTGIADVSFFDAMANDGNGARLGDAVGLPPRQSTMLAPDSLKIRFAGLDAPLSIGDTFLVTLVFERAGPVTVEFWVEGEAMALIPAAEPDGSTTVEDEALLRALLRRDLGARAEIVTLAISGPAAVAGWIGEQEAGRAFLRRDGEGWRMTLLSGESLATLAGLRAQGLSPRVARELLIDLETIETALPAGVLARLNSFQGTLLIPAR